MPPHFPILRDQDSHHRQPSFTMIIRADQTKHASRALLCSTSSPCSSFHLHCTARVIYIRVTYTRVICAAQLTKIWYSTVHGRRGGRARRKTQWKECDKTREHTERSPSPIYLSYKTRPIFFRILPPRFFPDPIPILIIHLFVCYTPRQGDVFVSSLFIFGRTVFDMIVIPYLSVLRPPLNTTLGEPITHFAKQLTSQEMNQQLIPTYLSIYWGGFPLPGEATARC